MLSANYGHCTIVYNYHRHEFLMETDKVMEDDLIAKLLQPLKIAFYECYDITEIISFLPKNTRSTQMAVNSSSFLELIREQQGDATDYRTSYIGYAKLADTSKLHAIINKLQPALPHDCKISFQNQVADQYPPSLQVYALKNNDQKLELSMLLDSVSMQFDERGYPIIRISFNQKGTSAFALITEKNINRALALVIDDLVYSAPIVTGKIEGGHAEIAGSFTVREAALLGKMLTGGYLPLNLVLLK